MKNKIYTIKQDCHDKCSLTKMLKDHPEIQFVSFMGIDIGGNETDEKIPVKLFLEDLEDLLKFGIQTDGSSVELQGIAILSNARVDLKPDLDCVWFVDYNHDFIYEGNGLPVGTLKIPAFLIHNHKEVCSRSILKRAIDNFKDSIRDILYDNDDLCRKYGFKYDEIDKIILTSATELEMWVQSPEQSADLEALSASQTLKEQYWKRTRGTVRTVLEKSIIELENYGLEPEMAHKEVGGITNSIDSNGKATHIMEQLEIDWKYSSALQAADNEIIVRDILEDMFRSNGLIVSFKAKPMEGVAGNGEHVHLGVAIKLTNGKVINIFAPVDMKLDYLSEFGYGALMGLLKNYEVINPFVTATNDAFNRLKPGFEAPVCIVTSLGGSKEEPSRNRSVLVGVIRNVDKPLATRFELRSPNPYSNTYLVMAASFQAMLDGITNVIKLKMTTSNLEKEISKTSGEDALYLEKDRQYLCEENVFEHYTAKQREELFGVAPETVWENLDAFNKCTIKQNVLKYENVFSDDIINSFMLVALDKWVNELKGRIISNNANTLRKFVKLHTENDCDLDVVNWENILHLKTKLMKDNMHKKSIFTQLIESLDNKNYNKASELQKTMNIKMTEIRLLYSLYKRNIF
ncbi:glutamine synthetase [Sedimentibacter sp. zth1]|uniref:glutamine synthetase n=1 Tax=Sedimentibacter sp. zth1 TaxID=2816908 RepID=UPI001A92628F|nr:glutamine synthetase [Sedimentibacter sp. zth1]QSX05090.1 glutamine synthetase [Sedimentibacter sp. zth1]